LIPQRKTLVFILRIWAEYLVNDAEDLRGEIEDVTTHEKHYFANFADLENLLRTQPFVGKLPEHPGIDGTSLKKCRDTSDQ